MQRERYLAYLGKEAAKVNNNEDLTDEEKRQAVYNLCKSLSERDYEVFSRAMIAEIKKGINENSPANL